MEKGRPVYYEFGRFRLYPFERLLLRDGRPVQLRPKAFDTLLAFIQNGGRLLGKDELMTLIWRSDVVEEGNLTQNIFMLRKILGESPTDHQYIVTIPGKGYRFVSGVREVMDEEEASRLPPASPAPGEGGTREAIKSVAVLPFKNLFMTRDTEHLGIVITDALITCLSNLEQVCVRPTTAVYKYVGSDDDAQAIGKSLEVDAVLVGTIQKTADRVRATSQLVRVKDGRTLWAEKADEKWSDIFSLQDSISERLARLLILKLFGMDQEFPARRYTENVEAFRHYIRGRYFWNKRSVAGLMKGLEFAQKAIDLDPTYAPAFIGLADSYNLLAGHGEFPPHDTFPKARAAAMRALEIDNGLAEAYASLGFVSCRYEWDWAKAEEHFKLAIRSKPSYPTAHHWYGECLAAAGRFEESLDHLTHALKLDPLSLPINTDIGQTLYFSGRYGEAVRQLEKTLEMDEGHVRARIILGAACEQKGDLDRAVTELALAREIEGRNTLAAAGLGHALALSGREGEARRVLRELLSLSRTRYVSASNIAMIHVGLGQHAEAVRWLERAHENRDVWLVWLKVNPRLKRIRSLKGFRALGLPWA